MYSIGNQGKIMRKLLGKPLPDSAHDAHVHAHSHSPSPTAAATAAAAITSSPLAPNYRPTASQDVLYHAGVPIACLDSSPDGRSAVLAGRHVLKTITFDGLAVKEGIDLRALLLAQPSQRYNTPASVADQLSVKAVRWGESQGNPAIFTAGTGGKIFQYDLVRAGFIGPGAPVDCVQIREDSRQVNALDINPHRNSWLLSGSQDGIVRCFDVRQPTQARAGATFRSIQAFRCHADGVRHVQWNPRDGFLFACATEQGSVMKWDMRKPNAAVLRIKAHDRTCTAMAWHPDGIHLASAGVDSKCYVWDMSRQDKRQKPKWTLSTPAPAGTLAWRPGQWSATARGKRASQLAVSYDESSQKRYGISAVHVWDFARPTMPYKEVCWFESSPSAMLWRDQYLLWTAGQDGIFSQCDISFAPNVIDRQAVSTMTFSPQGDVLMLLDERPPPQRRPRPHIVHHDTVAVPSFSSSPTTPQFSVSRSDSEDDAIGSFIGPRWRGSRRRRPSTRSTAMLSTTPPAGPGMEEVMSLEQTIRATGTYKPQQAMAVSHVPAAANAEVYGYLAVNYLEALHRDLPYSPGASPLPDRIATILEHYARAAAHVKKFRLAQTWRILAFAVDMLLHRRAQYHLERRMDRHHYAVRRKSEAKAKAKAKALAELFSAPMQTTLDGEDTPRKVVPLTSFDNALRSRSLLSEELESTSNVPTPLARPVPDLPDVDRPDVRERGRKLTPIVEPESFTLPPAARPPSLDSRKRLDSVPLSVASHESEATYASTEGYDFYDTEALANAIDVPRMRSAPTQALDYRRPASPPRGARHHLVRHDSGESYVHLFSISNESRRTTGLTTSSDGSLTGRTAEAAALAELQNRDREQFESRMRGDEVRNTPDSTAAMPPHRLLQRTETDMTTFTDEHHAITQTTTDSFESRFPSQPEPDAPPESPLQQPSPPESPLCFEDDQSPFIVETDYLCWPDDHPYPYPAHPSTGAAATPATPSSPLQPYDLISRALAFEAKSSALNASAIVLLLKPLLPEDVIDRFQASAILRQHHSRLMSMKLFTQAALLRKLCMQGWPGAPLSHWGENYPAIFSPAQQGVQAGFVCTACHKPRDIDRSATSTESVWTCERCRAVMAPCAICGERDSAPALTAALPLPSPSHPPAPASAPDPDPTTTSPASLPTWWYCPGCAHGGHASCMQAWHAALLEPAAATAAGESDPLADPAGAAEPADGRCPLDGCGHACLPSRRAAEAGIVRAEEVRRVVGEATRAVAKATAAAAAAAAAAAVAAGGAGGGGSGGGAAAAAAGAYYGPGTGEVGLSGQFGDEHLVHGEAGGAAGLGGGGSGAGGGGHGGGGGRYAAAAVRSDGYDVPQSRAVETVREALAGAAGLGGGSARAAGAAGILSSSPGRSPVGLERERRKSVKFVASPDERR
ncbi:787e5f86-6b8f-4401-a052-dd6355bc31e3 [Thermothielavioides terrestris]|uniref:787e5f86-6b8f-4401-a052-dd6355bc31e3 n=1 Tax=Thermothielavioides terrestris TaxID=2587410 RepID=A0A446B599_9PEZI|nr:787e5f86-6b8f-4401-a052-dd6355bc31e3 [Thermothielavioides terrestris]